MTRHSIFLALAVLLLSPVAPAQALFDTTGPTVGYVSPLVAQYTVPQTFRVSATDASGVASCDLVVSSIYQTPMIYNASNSLWEVSYTFITYRSANSIRAVCFDTAGNKTTGPSRVMTVMDAPIVVPPADTTPPVGDGSTIDATDLTPAELTLSSPVLIKTVCPGGESAAHPCRTVYFLDNVGVRHAFPNEKAYFTWYSGWDNINLIADEAMAAITLGRNVRYHPGVRMVKFPSVPTVYFVGAHGLLTPVATEAVAASMYGSNWNQYIDDLSEVFVTNYVIATSPLVSGNLALVTSTVASVSTINDNLGLATLAP